MTNIVSPILPVADPFVTRYEGKYYMMGTTGRNVTMWLSERLGEIEQHPTVVWTPQEGEPAYQIWSPTLFKQQYQGADYWFIYFTASMVDTNEAHRIYVLQSSGNDPLGPYTFKGQLGGSGDECIIDPSIVVIKDQAYMMYVKEPGENVCHIVPLRDPLTQEGESSPFIYPDQPWERGEGAGQSVYPVAEGPTALYHEGRIFVVYSGTDTGNYNYCLGLLTYQGGNPLDRKNWSKSGPIFEYSEENAVYGPGRATFTTSPDGSEHWILYHAKETKEFTYANRTTRAQRFAWNQDGTPNFGIPVRAHTPFDPPSGE